MAPDGSYLISQSIRPITDPKPGDLAPHAVSNLWRINRMGPVWSEAVRLPDSVNIGSSIWKPSMAADGTIYFTYIDNTGNKRLYASAYKNGSYEVSKPLSFSDGTTGDIDPRSKPRWFFPALLQFWPAEGQ